MKPGTNTQMQAILTKYLPATNTRGSRIKASCERGSITIEYPHHCNAGEDAHRAAVEELISRFLREDLKSYGTNPEINPWGRAYVSGGLPDGTYAHVFLPKA